MKQCNTFVDFLNVVVAKDFPAYYIDYVNKIVIIVESLDRAMLIKLEDWAKLETDIAETV